MGAVGDDGRGRYNRRLEDLHLTLILLLYAATLFVGATLLFVVQPMVGKMILPLLGGTPAVWSTCMVFFQAALLGGYAYAHATTAWLGIRRQTILHLALLAVPLAVLPLGVDASRLPGGEANPVLGVLVLLSLSVGLPFFVVSATAPLLQHWFTHTGSPGGPRPLLPLRRQQSREHARAAELPRADRAAAQAQRWPGGSRRHGCGPSAISCSPS